MKAINWDCLYTPNHQFKKLKALIDKVLVKQPITSVSDTNVLNSHRFALADVIISPADQTIHLVLKPKE